MLAGSSSKPKAAGDAAVNPLPDEPVISSRLPSSNARELAVET
jgi:hypothetical protein